eukprot:1361280-Rhodomonas_salina.1
MLQATVCQPVLPPAAVGAFRLVPEVDEAFDHAHRKPLLVLNPQRNPLLQTLTHLVQDRELFPWIR